MRVLKDTIPQVRTGKTCLTKNATGNFTFAFENEGHTKDFDCSWCVSDEKKGKSKVLSENFLWEEKTSCIKADYGSDNPSDPLPPTPLWNVKTLNSETDICKNPL